MHFLQHVGMIVSQRRAWLALSAVVLFTGFALGQRIGADPVNDLRDALRRSALLVRLQDPGFATRYEDLLKNIRDNKGDQKQSKKLEDEREKLLAGAASTAHLP